jgi:hypothetical protein
MSSIKQFDFIKKAGFKNTYLSIETALSFYNSNPDICCEKFRQTLEYIIEDVSHIANIKIQTRSLKDKIDALEKFIPDELNKDLFIKEMHNIRKIGNNYVHRLSSIEINPYKDRLTCVVGIKNIGHWMVNFSNKYPKYLKKEEERKRKRNKKIKKGVTVVSVLGTIGAILYKILFSDKK